MSKQLSAILAGAFTLLVCGIAQAAPPETPEASNSVSFEGLVPLECSVDIPSVSSNNGNGINYVATTPAGGLNGDIDEYEGTLSTPANFPAAALEMRTTSLSAQDSITFDCNSDTVAITVDLDSLTLPTFTNAVNLIDVTHTVALADSEGGTYTDSEDMGAVTTATGTDDIITSTAQPTDDDGDLVLTLTSTIDANEEELAAGNYGATFTVTVLAEGAETPLTAD